MSGHSFLIYVMGRCSGGDLLAPSKIGYSRDTALRLRQINTSSPFRVDVLWEIECPTREVASELEGLFKRLEKDVRLNGEWFDLPPEEALRRLCRHYRNLLACHFSERDVAGYLSMAGVDLAAKRFRLSAWA